jgi:hypothetical protein
MMRIADALQKYPPFARQAEKRKSAEGLRRDAASKVTPLVLTATEKSLLTTFEKLFKRGTE